MDNLFVENVNCNLWYKNLIVFFDFDFSKYRPLSLVIKMDIINNYDIVTYKFGDRDKYTNVTVWDDCSIYYMNGQRHRDNDMPAIICASGSQEWWFNGHRHRDNDLPAVIESNGIQEYYVNGQFIRRKY